jgi:ABC-2 type transport system permease protein
MRYLRTVLRSPASFLPSFIISVFTLLIYKESLGGAASFLPGLTGKNYVAFILPGAILSSALSSSGIAGQAIVRDISTGYFDKLLLTPVRRTVLLLSATLVGAVLLGVQTTLVAIVGVLLGLNPPTGILGIAAVIGIAVLVGNALGGFTVGIALRSGNPAATQGASFLFFPLTLLTAAFTPIELLGPTLRKVAEINPITYVLNSMRTMLLDGWGNTSMILTGVFITLAISILTFGFAFTGLQSRTRRK